MSISKIILLLNIVLFTSAENICLSCDLQECQNELQKCQKALKEDGENGSYLDQVCRWIGNPGKAGKATLKTTVHNYLKALGLDKAELDIFSGKKDAEVLISLSHTDISNLRHFLLNDDGDEGKIQDILANSITRVHHRRKWYINVSLTFMV